MASPAYLPGIRDTGTNASKSLMMRETSARIASSHCSEGPKSPERASFAVRGSRVGYSKGDVGDASKVEVLEDSKTQGGHGEAIGGWGW